MDIIPPDVFLQRGHNPSPLEILQPGHRTYPLQDEIPPTPPPPPPGTHFSSLKHVSLDDRVLRAFKKHFLQFHLFHLKDS